MGETEETIPVHPPLADRPPAVELRGRGIAWGLFYLALSAALLYALVSRGLRASSGTAEDIVSVALLALFLMFAAQGAGSFLLDPVRGWRVDADGLHQLNVHSIITTPWRAIERIEQGRWAKRLARITIGNLAEVTFHRHLKGGWRALPYLVFVLIQLILMDVILLRWKRLSQVRLLFQDDSVPILEMNMRSTGGHLVVLQHQLGCDMRRFLDLCQAWMADDRAPRTA